MKKNKDYVLYTLLLISGFAVWYLGISFVIMDLNVANWNENTRGLLLLEGFITSVFIFAITYMNRNDKQL